MGNDQLERSGESGESYTNRNVIDWRLRSPAFQDMLTDLPVRGVLEVGCNRGHNLPALIDTLPNGSHLIGVEPYQYALKLAIVSSSEVGAV